MRGQEKTIYYFLLYNGLRDIKQIEDKYVEKKKERRNEGDGEGEDEIEIEVEESKNADVWRTYWRAN